MFRQWVAVDEAVDATRLLFSPSEPRRIPRVGVGPRNRCTGIAIAEAHCHGVVYGYAVAMSFRDCNQAMNNNANKSPIGKEVVVSIDNNLFLLYHSRLCARESCTLSSLSLSQLNVGLVRPRTLAIVAVDSLSLPVAVGPAASAGGGVGVLQGVLVGVGEPRSCDVDRIRGRAAVAEDLDQSPSVFNFIARRAHDLGVQNSDKVVSGVGGTFRRAASFGVEGGAVVAVAAEAVETADRVDAGVWRRLEGDAASSAGAQAKKQKSSELHCWVKTWKRRRKTLWRRLEET